MVVHAVSHVSHRGVLRLLADAEYGDAGVLSRWNSIYRTYFIQLNLVGCNQLLRTLGQTVEFLDPLHEDRLVGPAVALVSGGVLQSLALLGVTDSIAHHTPAYHHVGREGGLVVAAQLGGVTGGLYCLGTTSVSLRFSSV